MSPMPGQIWRKSDAHHGDATFVVRGELTEGVWELVGFAPHPNDGGWIKSRDGVFNAASFKSMEYVGILPLPIS